MNRQDFGEWGIELKPEEFAGALAFLLRVLYRDTPAEILAKFIGIKEFAPVRDKTDRYFPIGVCFDSTFHQLDKIGMPPAAFLYSEWLNYVEELKKNHQISEDERYLNSQYRLLPRPFRLRFELLTNPENAFWLSEQLSQLNDGDASVYLRIDEPGTEVGWNWALKVGFLKDENSRRLREELERFVGENKFWLGNLVEFVFLDSENDNCDLLIIPEDLRSALSAALKFSVKVSADCVLIIGRTNENPEDIPALIDALRRLISTAGVGIVNVQPEKRIYWFTELIRELSHDEPIDVALFAACRTAETPTPFLVASDKLIRFSRLVESIKSIGEKLIKFGTDEIIEVFEKDAYNFGIDSGSYNWKDFGEKLIKRSNDFRIDREETSATSAVNVNREIKEKISTVTKPKKNEIRWIQSQVYDLSRSGEKKLLRRALRRNAPHEAVVRIGLSSEDWIQSEERFRAEMLPPNKESYNLTVVFTEPQLFEEAQVSSITLPARGNSSECRFFFHVNEKIERIEARISILYKNRVLQTALLRASVSNEPLEAPDSDKIEITREAIVRADFYGLKERRYFDAAFILNEDLNRIPKITAIKDQFVSFSTIESLTEFNRQVDKFLTDISDEPEKYEGGLETPATRKLLGVLAKHGHNFFDSLEEHEKGNSTLTLAAIMDGLRENEADADNPKRIQIISANPDTRLPFEFIYDREVPSGENFELCPQTVSALEQGKCFSDCPGTKNPENYFCPLGFWGLTKIIERHTHNRKYTSETVQGDFRFQVEPVEDRKHLEVFKKVLFTASNKADVKVESAGDNKESKKSGLELISSALSKITNSQITKIVSWDDWCEHIKSDAPSALVLLTHTETVSGGILALEIEDGSKPDMRLESSSIERKHVYCIDNAVSIPDHLPPIVFLIGCETGKAKIEFASLMAKFRQKGAAIIVSTGVTIRGRHAVPVTEELLKTLHELTKEPKRSFGEAMRLVKQKTLARGFPMVLTLMSYGDADWQIGKSEK